MLFFYIRHGDPIYDPDSLTPLGIRQAEAVSRRLCTFGLDKIYASSSTRAKLTAKPTCDILNIEPQILDWCNESYAWRDFTAPVSTGGIRWIFQHPQLRRVLASPEINAMGEEWHLHPAFSETRCTEGIERIRSNTFRFFAELGYTYDPKENVYLCTRPNEDRVALFAHQGFGLAFLSTLLRIPYPLFTSHFDMGHSAVSVIEFPDLGGYSIPCALQVSNDSHIYADRLPLNYQNRIRF